MRNSENGNRFICTGKGFLKERKFELVTLETGMREGRHVYEFTPHLREALPVRKGSGTEGLLQEIRKSGTECFLWSPWAEEHVKGFEVRVSVNRNIFSVNDDSGDTEEPRMAHAVPFTERVSDIAWLTMNLRKKVLTKWEALKEAARINRVYAEETLKKAEEQEVTIIREKSTNVGI